ncbi:histidine kinase dimerization/phospho-acceptor domain-containing protein [Bdellovibrionota bacterium FG-2]
MTGAPHIRFYAGAPLKSPSGHLIGTLCVIDRKPRRLNLEQIEDLQMLARQVVNQLELRLHPIREKDLVLAKKSAEAAVMTKTMFLANMSHAIRTPLNGILGMVNLLPRRPLEKRPVVAGSKPASGKTSHGLNLNRSCWQSWPQPV